MAVHGEHHKETVGSRKNLARFLKDLAPCSPGPCLISDFRRLEVNASRHPTSAGAWEGGGGAGTSAFGRPNCPAHCPVKAGRQGVCDIHKSPGNLLIVGKLGISTHVWRRGGWFRCLEFASYQADLRTASCICRLNTVHQRLRTRFKLILV